MEQAILIAGATGNLGFRISKVLAKKGITIILKQYLFIE